MGLPVTRLSFWPQFTLGSEAELWEGGPVLSDGLRVLCPQGSAPPEAGRPPPRQTGRGVGQLCQGAVSSTERGSRGGDTEETWGCPHK